MTSSAEMLVRLILGAVMGAVIGFEREAHGRPAGLRTHLLVCLSAVLIMLISENYFNLIHINPRFVRLDPARLVAGATTGIGFLGAGVIIKTRGTVYGLTTAACIWIVFAIGLAVGSGFYMPAAITFVLTYFTLWVLRVFERKIPKDTFKSITVLSGDRLNEDELRSVISRLGSVIGMEYEKDFITGQVSYHIHASFKRTVPTKEIFSELLKLQGITRVRIGTS